MLHDLEEKMVSDLEKSSIHEIEILIRTFFKNNESIDPCGYRVTPFDIARVEEFQRGKYDDCTNRTTEEKYKHRIMGFSAESFCASILGAVLNPLVHNHTVEESFAYDMTVDGMTIDVKCVAGINNKNNFLYVGSKFNTFFSLSKRPDVLLILNAFTDDYKYFKFTFCLILNGKTFEFNLSNTTEIYYQDRIAGILDRIDLRK